MNVWDILLTAGIALFIYVWLRQDAVFRRLGSTTGRVLCGLVSLASVAGFMVLRISTIPWWWGMLPGLGMVVVLGFPNLFIRLADRLDGRSRDIQRR